jgi:hypothetical protein
MTYICRKTRRLAFGSGREDFWIMKTDMQGIPEFLSWALLLLLLVAIVAVEIVYTHSLRKQTRRRL